MLYVQQSLSPDEELIHVGQFHWMYLVMAFMNIFWGFVGCVLVIWGSLYFMDTVGGGFQSEGTIGKIRELHPGLKLMAFFMIVMGLLACLQMMIVRETTEIAITTSRLIYKRGLVARHVGEMSIDRIEGVNVLQSIMGRILGYGRVAVRGMGVGEVVLPPLDAPVKFRKAIEKARTT